MHLSNKSLPCTGGRRLFFSGRRKLNKRLKHWELASSAGTRTTFCMWHKKKLGKPGKHPGSAAIAMKGGFLGTRRTNPNRFSKHQLQAPGKILVRCPGSGEKLLNRWMGSRNCQEKNFSTTSGSCMCQLHPHGVTFNPYYLCWLSGYNSPTEPT